MRWWCVLSVILLCNVVTSKQATGEAYTDPITGCKCCPCPDDPTLGTSSHQRTVDTSPLGIDWSGLSRGADSTGAHSIFSPNVMRGVGPFGSPESGKQTKPLLRPEVDFASSMVDTLREATDEEYRDALLREAARRSSKAAQSPLWPLKDVASDDVIMNTNAEETNPSTLLTELLSIPNSFKDLFAVDNNAAASAINEQRLAGASAKDGDNLKANLDPLNIFSEGGCLKSPKFDLKSPSEVNLFNRNNDRAGILKSTFDKNSGSKSFLQSLPKIGDLIKANERKSTDSDYSPSNVEQSLSYPGIKSNSNKKIPQLLLPSSNRDAASDMFRDLFTGTGKFSLSDLLHPPTQTLPAKKSSDNQNPSLNKMNTEIIETVDSDALNPYNGEMGSTVGNNVAEAKEKDVSFLNINKLPFGNHNTKIITHIPTSDGEETGEFESVDFSASNNNDRENIVNDFNQNQDTLPDASNDISKYALFSQNPEKTFQNNMDQIFEQPMSALFKSSKGDNEISKNLSKLRKDISEGLEKLRAAEIIKLSSANGDPNELVNTDVLQKNSNKMKNNKSLFDYLASQKDDSGNVIANKKSMAAVLRNAGDAVNKKINDMTSEASEHMSNFFNNVQAPQIVQPATLFDEIENPFDSLTGDLANIFHTPSPTNDDLLSRIDEWLSSSDVQPDFNSALLTSLLNNNLLGSTALPSHSGLPRPIGLQRSMGNRKPSNLFQSTNNLPDIHDIGESLLENTQNFLSKPLLATNGNILQETLRSGQDLSESLKDQARSTVNNLQNNLSKSLKEVGMLGRRTPDFDNPLPFSTDAIEDLITRHEDLEGRLRGIQYDLSDHLETLRNNILDHLPNPSMIGESSDIKIVREPFNFSNVKARNQQATDKIQSPFQNGKLLNLLTSASKLSPSSNDKLRTPLYRSPGTSSSLLFGSNNRAMPTLNKTPKNQPKSKTAPVLAYKKRPLISKSQSKLKSSLGDSLLQKPLTGLQLLGDELGPLSSLRNMPNSVSKSSSKLNSGRHSAPSAIRSSTLRSQSNQLPTSQPIESEQASSSLPKTLDKTILTKIRNSINERLSSFGRNSNADDMFQSASHNLNTAPDWNTMKEQVPYTCNMVCKKV